MGGDEVGVVKGFHADGECEVKGLSWGGGGGRVVGSMKTQGGMPSPLARRVRLALVIRCELPWPIPLSGLHLLTPCFG